MESSLLENALRGGPRGHRNFESTYHVWERKDVAVWEPGGEEIPPPLRCRRPTRPDITKGGDDPW